MLLREDRLDERYITQVEHVRSASTMSSIWIVAGAEGFIILYCLIHEGFADTKDGADGLYAIA